MAMHNVFTGANGTLIISKEDTPEGQDAEAIANAYAGFGAIARVTNVEVYVQTELEEFHEVGRRHPVSLHSGNIRISGKVGQAYVNGALLWLLLGRGASANKIAEPYVQPAFNMVLSLDDPAVPGNEARLELKGVKFQNWGYALPDDDFVMQNVTLKALAIRVLDKEAPAGGGEATVKAPSFPEAS